MKARALAAAGLALAAQGALAHSDSGAGSAFFAPLADAALVIAIIASALWIGQQGRSRLVVGAFAAALLAGLALNHYAGAARTQDALLAATAATGVLVVVGRRWPAWWVATLGVAVGVNLGRGVELGAGASRLAAAASAWVLACAAVLLGAWLVAQLRWPWARIGVRVAASWISASALLVLALAFAP